MLPGMLIIVVAFAAILGMQMSLRCRKTVVAVMSSVGIVVGICAALGWCGYQMLQSSGSAASSASVAGSFSPFTLLTMLIDPYAYAGRRLRRDRTTSPTARMARLHLHLDRRRRLHRASSGRCTSRW